MNVSVEELTAWLQQQRWFGGKGVPISKVEVMERLTLPASEGLSAEGSVVQVTYLLGSPERYLVFLERGEDGELRDALEDPSVARAVLDFARERDRVRTRINAVDDVDLLLVDQAFGLIDRNVGLALGIGGERGDLVLATDAALLVDEIDGDLRADRGGNRPARSKRTGQVVDQADAQRLGLCPCAGPIEAQHGGRSRGIPEQRSA